MQFRGSRTRLIIANLNIVTQWCAENINIIASNIPQMKIIAVSQWTARFNMQRKPEKCWFLLRNLSFGLFDHKKIPGLFQDLSKISAKFQDFSGLVGTMKKYITRTRIKVLNLAWLWNKATRYKQKTEIFLITRPPTCWKFDSCF